MKTENKMIAIVLILSIALVLLIRKLMKKKTYFSIKELEASDTAKRNGIDNTAPAAERIKLQNLIDNVLDPTRRIFGSPIYVNSGYRSQQVNRLVGGANGSQHTKGEAADITANSRENNRKIFEIIRTSCDYDQLINEHDYSWIHVSYKSADDNRHQILSIS